MAWRVNEVNQVFFAICCFVDHSHSRCFDCDTAFTFQIHIVQQLGFHLTVADSFRHLQQAVSKGAFAMVDMGNN